jgi:hypothetical protein
VDTTKAPCRYVGSPAKLRPVFAGEAKRDRRQSSQTRRRGIQPVMSERMVKELNLSPFACW